MPTVVVPSGGDGGGLTTVADDTLSSGAVTLFETDDIAWEDGVMYEVSTMMIQDGVAADVQFALTLDGSTTGTDYNQVGAIRSISSEAFQATDSQFSLSAGRTGGDGQVAYARATIIRHGTEFFVTSCISTKLVSTYAATRIISFRFDNGNTTIALGVLSHLATRVADGSKIKVMRLG